MAYNNNNNNYRKENKGLSVAVYNDNIEQALRKFKKKMNNDGKLQEVRERAYFTPAFETKKKKKAAAKSRWRKQLSMDNPKTKRLY